jgi:hypothetical protein
MRTYTTTLGPGQQEIEIRWTGPSELDRVEIEYGGD